MLTIGVRRSQGLLFLAVSVAALLLFAPLASAAPGNDQFADAVSLSPAPPVEFSGNNQDASKEAGEPDHAGNAGGHSVWFSWTPAVSGPVAINTAAPRSSKCWPLSTPALPSTR